MYGSVSGAATPTHGIATRGSGATFELWLLVLVVLQALVLRFPPMTPAIHVDDLSIISSEGTRHRLAGQAGLAVDLAMELLSESRTLAIAGEKAAVVASSPFALRAVITWPPGYQATHRSFGSPIRGRLHARLRTI